MSRINERDCDRWFSNGDEDGDRDDAVGPRADRVSYLNDLSYPKRGESFEIERWTNWKRRNRMECVAGND